MKTLIHTLIFTLLGSIINSADQNVNEPDPMIIPQKEVQNLMDKSPCKIPIEEDYEAKIEIVPNDKKEIVVLETDCSNPEIES